MFFLLQVIAQIMSLPVLKNTRLCLQAECTKDKDCAANKFCSQFLYKCQKCIDNFGCFSTRQCCGGKVCKFGRCVTEPGEFNNYVVQYWYMKSARCCELHRFQANVVSAVLVFTHLCRELFRK